MTSQHGPVLGGLTLPLPKLEFLKNFGRVGLKRCQMLGTDKAFCVNFVDILCTGRSSGNPTVDRRELDAANGSPIAGRRTDLLQDKIAAQLGG